MKHAWIVRTIVVAAIVLLAIWIVRNTSWVEVEETTPPTGAATRPWYSLGKVATAAGTTVVQRTALEPMPPQDATLFLESAFWDIFPERDAHLKAWVEGGGHLVLLRRRMPARTLGWVPPTFMKAHKAKTPADTASGAGAVPQDNDDEDEDEDDRPAKPVKPKPNARVRGSPFTPAPEKELCEPLVEQPGSQAAFQPGRAYQRCLKPSQYEACVDRHLVRSPRATPDWALGNDQRVYAMRVPLGRGSVTEVAECLPVGNDTILLADHALIASAVLQLRPGATLWIVDDEAGEPLHTWLWHHARAPLLLMLAAIGLALWRLMVRFGPREAPVAQARRSMGEQVRGTGEFIARHDVQALHAATRKAFDDAARVRIDGWAERTDSERIMALAASGAPTVTLDKAALLAALHPGPRSTFLQWIAAIEVIEQARRALLRAAAAPPPP